jgi:hypothetical protein
MWSGGIHDSGNSPIINSSRNMAGVRTIALGVLLVPAPGGRLSRFSEVDNRSDAPQLLSHEPPARRRLQPDLELLATEPLTEPAHASTVRGRDPRPGHLASLGIDPFSSDLRSMLINPITIAISGLLKLRGFNGLRGQAPRLT